MKEVGGSLSVSFSFFLFRLKRSTACRFVVLLLYINGFSIHYDASFLRAKGPRSLGRSKIEKTSGKRSVLLCNSL